MKPATIKYLLYRCMSRKMRCLLSDKTAIKGMFREVLGQQFGEQILDN